MLTTLKRVWECEKQANDFPSRGAKTKPPVRQFHIAYLPHTNPTQPNPNPYATS